MAISEPIQLIKKIQSAIRAAAERDHSFFPDGGMIRVKFRPFCKEADDLLGGGSDFTTDPENPDFMSYSGDCFILRNNPLDFLTDPDSEEEYACAAIAEAKIAACDKAVYDGLPAISGLKHFSENDPTKFKMENGLAPWMGAITITVHKDRKRFLEISVAVSGSPRQEVDLACVAMATPVIEEYFREKDGFYIENPLSTLDARVLLESFVTKK